MVVAVRDPIKYLEAFIGARVGRQLEPHDVVYILKTAAREIVPTAGLQGRCPQLEMFSDWTVHGELTRSKGGQAAIARIAEAIPLHGTGGRDNKWLEEEVNGGVSFGGLRLELLSLCQRFHLRDDMFTTWEAWQRFALPLAFEVSGRPIRLGREGKPAKSARTRIASTSLPAHHQPDMLTLIRIEDDPHVTGFHWEVKVPAVSLSIQVLFGGFRMSDFPSPAGWQPPV